MARQRVQIERVMGLVAMQKYRHGSNSDVSQCQGHDNKAPPGKIEQPGQKH